MAQSDLTAGDLTGELSGMYRERFPTALRERRLALWRTLHRGWFSKFVGAQDRVLEIAPGYCEFLNALDPKQERVGVDLNKDTASFAAPGITIHNTSAEKLAEVLPAGHFDVAFTSNFFEHCHNRDQILQIMRATRQVLRPGGRFLILGPNFRYCAGNYFDYFDHHLPLTDQSIQEALVLAGFEIERCWARLLPFTMRGKLPSWPWLVALYMKLPPLWRLFGAQFFVVARRA
jgi:SAM-dependent methyltransferase